MHLKIFLLTLISLLLLSACGGARPGKYKLTYGYGTYYIDRYSYSSGCTSFKYYIGGTLKGYKQICGSVHIEENK